MKMIIILMLFITSVYAETLRIKVTDSKAIYGEVLIQKPHTDFEIVNERVPYKCRKTGTSTNDEFWGSLGSMALGGLIGNQIGGGSGKDIATFVGVIGGANVAESARYGTCYRYEQVRRYTTHYEKEYKHSKIGYKNCGYVGNRKICKTSDYKKRYITLNY